MTSNVLLAALEDGGYDLATLSAYHDLLVEEGDDLAEAIRFCLDNNIFPRGDRGRYGWADCHTLLHEHLDLYKLVMGEVAFNHAEHLRNGALHHCFLRLGMALDLLAKTKTKTAPKTAPQESSPRPGPEGDQE